ncbi:hypothetical protein KCU96_g2674, partial [Aureobasidium melanogenum]
MARLSRIEGKFSTLDDTGAPDDMEISTEIDVNSQGDTESDEMLDFPPNREPAHLHSLFENAVVGHTSYSVDENYTQRKSTSTASKKIQLQVELRKLVPSDHDVRLAVDLAPDWLSPAGITFYPLAHQSTADILRTYKRIRNDDVEPAEIGQWVLHFAVVLHRLPQHVERSRFTSIPDMRDHISRSFETVERLIFNDDDILGTLKGLECGVLMNRFHLMMGQVKKVYINVRREITLALLYCPPDIQNPLQDASDINNSRSQISDEAKTKAFVWATLCCLDRISSLLLDLEPCTRALGFQPEAIVPVETTVTRRLFWSITELTIDILDRDKRYRLYPDISKITTDTALIHQRLCFLSTGVAESWHSSSSCDESSLSSFCHILMRYLIDYLSLRLHIPLMMHSKDLVEAANSRLISLDACRSMAKRYRFLRSPQFALLISARIIDFIAFTPVIILLFSLHHGLGESENLPTSVDVEADRVLLNDFVDALREVSSLHGSSTAAQVVTAVDTLGNVLENDDATAEDVTLRIPLLGLIKIRRKVQADTQSATTDAMDSIDSSWTQLLNNPMHETWLQGWETSQNYMSHNFSLELLDTLDLNTC